MYKRTLIIFSASLLACGFMTGCARNQGVPIEVVDETYIHHYGVEVPKQDWASRGQNGKVVATLTNGVTVTKTYAGGVLNGETTYTFPHVSALDKSETYANNILIKEVNYYSSGSPRQEIDYPKEGGKRLITWYESGAPKSIENYNIEGVMTSGEYHDIKHQMDSWVDSGEGMRVVRDAYGQLISRDTIQNGIMASRTTYHPNGAPHEITPYSKGVVDGVRKSFLPAGEPNTIEEWMDGKQQGITVLFRNGEKYAEVPYSNGNKDGIERHYRDGTVVVEEIYWRDGKLHGPSTIFVGDTNRTQWYYFGEPVTKGNFDIRIRSLPNSAG